jgi:DNA-binding MarR family transcriptional regulator
VSRDSKRDLFLEVMLACREYSQRLDQTNQRIGELMRVNRTDHRVLELLNRHGPMAAGDLAEEAGLTTGAVTAVVDRLEKLGYAQRVRDTVDRRRVVIEQTPESERLGRQYYAPFMARGFAAMRRYTADQLTAIRDFMLEIAALTAEYGQTLRASDPDGTGEDTDESTEARG